jgi:hypothetical protein
MISLLLKLLSSYFAQQFFRAGCQNKPCPDQVSEGHVLRLPYQVGQIVAPKPL